MQDTTALWLWSSFRYLNLCAKSILSACRSLWNCCSHCQQHPPKRIVKLLLQKYFSNVSPCCCSIVQEKDKGHNGRQARLPFPQCAYDTAFHHQKLTLQRCE